MKGKCKCGHLIEDHSRTGSGMPSYCNKRCICNQYEETTQEDFKCLSTNELFRKLWSASVGSEDFDKSMWMELEARIIEMQSKIDYASKFLNPQPNELRKYVNIFGTYV